MRTMQGRAHHTRAPCEPLIATLSSCAWRQACRASLACELETATTLRLDHVGVPISSEAIASLCGVAKRHGVGETQDAARIALHLPALCGLPTREEAEQVLQVSVARQHEVTAQFTSLTKQRREVLCHPERLENLGLPQGSPDVELILRPKNRSNYQGVANMSDSCRGNHGPPLRSPDGLHFLENVAPPGTRGTALTS